MQYHLYTDQLIIVKFIELQFKKTPDTKVFVKKLEEYYSSLSLLKENEWHDSYIFDVVRKENFI